MSDLPRPAIQDILSLNSEELAKYLEENGINLEASQILKSESYIDSRL